MSAGYAMRASVGDEDPVVTEALTAFARDLDYATALVALHTAAPVAPPCPRPRWGSPPRFVSDAEVWAGSDSGAGG